MCIYLFCWYYIFKYISAVIQYIYIFIHLFCRHIFIYLICVYIYSADLYLYIYIYISSGSSRQSKTESGSPLPTKITLQLLSEPNSLRFGWFHSHTGLIDLIDPEAVAQILSGWWSADWSMIYYNDFWL